MLFLDQSALRRSRLGSDLAADCRRMSSFTSACAGALSVAIKVRDAGEPGIVHWR
ncbi:MAG TPA: hypothetical protein VIM12_13895 [Noviherbaspirillum sp.]|jgi:hypothetical protein|uniref:hypothetical protein n=1 Tax=Noviherbaspirillum sp. TaxID=1926288 RepID=UPI002F91E429